ncbi:hypothetical protein AHAS_Ahas05G0000300 [Arachis hypogaea]
MRTLCNVCENAAAILFCAADEAALCRSCDDKFTLHLHVNQLIMASVSSSTILQKLDSKDFIGFRSLFLEYFNDLNEFSMSKNQREVQSIAEKFYPFLMDSFGILHKHLENIFKSSKDKEILAELVKVYKMCLDCFDKVAPAMQQRKPYVAEFERLNFIKYLEKFGYISEAETESISLSKTLQDSSKPTERKSRKRIRADQDKCLGSLIVQNAVLMVSLTAALGADDNDDVGDSRFRSLLCLLEEMRPWLRKIDTTENLRIKLVDDLSRNAFKLLRRTNSDEDLIISFCRVTLTEYVKSPRKDKVYEIAQSMCSLLFELHKNKPNYIANVLDVILDCVLSECQLGEGNAGTRFIETVYFCVRSATEACTRRTVAVCLNRIAEHFKQVNPLIFSILRLYATGLLLDDSTSQSRIGDPASTRSLKFDCQLGNLLKQQNVLQTSLDSLCSVAEASLTYLPFCSHPLRFLCLPLANSIDEEMSQFVNKVVDASVEKLMSTVQDQFHILCNSILSSPSFTSEKNTNEFAEKCQTVISVALAAYTISIRTNLKVQESSKLVKQIIASKWLTYESISKICGCLNEIFVILFADKHKKALKVLNLYCTASWITIEYHCSKLTSGALKELVNNSCKRSTELLDAPYDINPRKIRKRLIEILKSWYTANSLSKDLPPPMFVMKWLMKIKQEHAKHIKEGVDSCSTEFSNKNVSFILEQELISYEAESLEHPKHSQKMLMKITKILLQYIYITDDLKRAQALLRRGKALRICTTASHDDCIQCLTDAITIMKNYGEMSANKNVIDHQLAVAYCLRALSTQEAEPKSVRISEDVESALDLWLDISRFDFPEDRERSQPFDSIMVLLYNTIDLVQLKGFLKLSKKAYQMVIRIFKRKFSTEKWLTLLWESRRLRHALCASPISDAFIQSSLDLVNELSKVDIWTSHLRENPIQLIGFQQNFSFLFASSDTDSSCYEACFQRKITIDDVKSAAEKLSNDSVPLHSTFLRGSLYYDLCSWLVANGQLREALSLAKEARNLYVGLCKEKFGDNFKKNRVNESVARKIAQFDIELWDFSQCYFSPWNSMQCYLESTLQVGLICKISGDAELAKAYFLDGKDTSYSLHLPSFIVAFCSELGKIYIEKRDWNSAEKELQNAKQILRDSNTTLCCSKCKLIFEVTLDQYYGDLHQSKYKTCEVKSFSSEHISFYESALAKLDLPEWKNSVSCPEDGSLKTAAVDVISAGTSCICFTMNEAAQNVIMEPTKEGSWHWHCIATEVLEGRLLSDFINFKWEFVRRKLSMKLLARLVRCFAYVGDETQKILLKSTTMLHSKNTFSETNSAIAIDYFQHIVPKVILGDMFAVERAEILKEICLYYWNIYNSKATTTRNIFQNESCISLKDLASWLMVAFVLSREVPDIFHKVSQLLAVTYVVSDSREQLSLPYISKSLGENAWASYFHQASIGTHDTHSSRLTGRCKGSDKSNIGGTYNLSRLVPDDTEVLAECVKQFLGDLPSTTVICLTLLGHDYASLLKEFSPSVKAWILLSRLTFESEPIVALLPLHPISEDVIDPPILPKYKILRDWWCPWGSTALDEVVPAFKNILKEDYSRELEENTSEQQQLWWNHRKTLNQRLRQLLRSIEESWFGSWKCLLLGELLNCKNFESLLEHLVKELRSECKLEVNEGLVRVILGGTRHVCGREKLKCKKDCYIAKVGHCDQGMSGILLNAADGFGVSSDKAFQLLKHALIELDADKNSKREPIILVLDYEVQMLPWENIPILRQLEVYRMPSVSSISALGDTGSRSQKEAGRKCPSFPSIDPLHAFYILNPDGTVPECQNEFENWFKENNLKGNTGLAPTRKLWASALEKHDLFIYIGHGSGTKYFSLENFQHLNKCGAVVLLGCNSGTVYLQGNCAPLCIPLQYLAAGSPAIVANLWKISAKDISTFGKYLLQAWVKKRFELEKECPNNCDHPPTLGAFIGRARDACEQEFMTGAAPVCYGVPTRICVKKRVSSMAT